MSGVWVAAGLLGLTGFLAGLGLAAGPGQTREGRFRPGAWRYGLLAAAGFALLAVSLTRAGAPDSARTYRQQQDAGRRAR